MHTILKNQLRKIRIIILRATSSVKAKHFPEVESALVIAPHPDDEIFGCAGLIQHLLSKQKKVSIIILSDGSASHKGCCNIKKKTITNRRRELAHKANSHLGVASKDLHFLDYPDGKISYNSLETLRLKSLIEQIQPDTILIPHHKEGWSDHIEAGNIIKKLAQENYKYSIYEYCVWFWYYNSWKLDWKNAYTLTMNSKEFYRKKEAINYYIEPLAPCEKPWSGVLPKLFIKATLWRKELFFKVK